MPVHFSLRLLIPGMIFCDNVLFSSTRTCEIKTGDLFSKQDEFVLSLEAEGGVAPPAM